MRNHRLLTLPIPTTLTIILTSFLQPTSSQITCYRPNGASSTHNDTQVCTSLEGAASMCCGPGDTCLNNGLCKVSPARGMTEEKPSYWRDTCSESEWPVVGCLRGVCTSKEDGLDDKNTLMTPCEDSDYSATWCCGTTTDCCGTDDVVHVPRNIYEPVSSRSVSTSTSTSSSSSSTSTSTPTHPATSSSPASSSSGLSTGGKAGVGVGVGVGGCVIIGLVVFFLIRRRRRNNAARQADMAYPGHALPQTQPQASHEKPAGLQDSRFELSGEPAAASRT